MRWHSCVSGIQGLSKTGFKMHFMTFYWQLNVYFWLAYIIHVCHTHPLTQFSYHFFSGKKWKFNAHTHIEMVNQMHYILLYTKRLVTKLDQDKQIWQGFHTENPAIANAITLAKGSSYYKRMARHWTKYRCKRPKNGSYKAHTTACTPCARQIVLIALFGVRATPLFPINRNVLDWMVIPWNA